MSVKKVLCAGTFDHLHPGHHAYFTQAKEHGDYLIAVVARDETVKRVKGRLPQQSEDERLAAVRAISIVDKALLGNHGDRFLVVNEQQPDVICLGYDQQVDEQKLQQRFPDIHIVRLKAHHPEKYKSSKMHAAS